MPSVLDKILQDLSPERIAEQVSIPVDTALASFPVQDHQIRGREDLLLCLSAFWTDAFGRIIRQPLDPDSANEMFPNQSNALKLLNAAFGRNAMDLAYLMASTGINGGLYSVLKAVAEKLIEESRLIYIDSMINKHLSGSSRHDQADVVAEYFERYSHLLPPDMKLLGPDQFVSELPRILYLHTRIADHLHGTM